MVRIFIAIILIFGAVVLAIFYLTPAWRSFQNLRTTTNNLQQISAELDDLTTHRDSLIGTINQISKTDLDRIGRILPQGANGAQFLVALEAVTLHAGLAINSIDIATLTGESPASTPRAQPKPGAAKAPEKAATAVGELPFTITVSGSYSAIKNFLADLERMTPLVDMTSITFNAPSKIDVFTVTIKAKTYYQ